MSNKIETVIPLTTEEKAAEAKVARETIAATIAQLHSDIAQHDLDTPDARRARATWGATADKLSWALRYGSDHLVRALAAGHKATHIYVAERVARELPAAKIAGEAYDIEDRVSPSETALDLAAAYRRLGYDASVSWVTGIAEPASDRAREAVTIIDVPWCSSWLIIDLETK